MTATQALHLDTLDEGDLVLVRLGGVINEDNRLVERLGAMSGRTVLLHLQRVERINSCGVRDWVHWVRAMEAQGNKLHLIRCSPPIVAQVNMVKNFCGDDGHVVSFLAPYFCGNCERDHHETLFSSAVASAQEAPVAICETCGEPMQFDDLAESYFSFTRVHGARPVANAVMEAIQKFGDAQMATTIAALKELSSAGRGSAAPTTAPGTAPGSNPRR